MDLRCRRGGTAGGARADDHGESAVDRADAVRYGRGAGDAGAGSARFAEGGGADAKEIEAATFVVKRANMAFRHVQAYDGMTETPVEINVLQIGPAVFIGTEGEPFQDIGKEIKKRSPFPYHLVRWVCRWLGGVYPHAGGLSGQGVRGRYVAVYARGGWDFDRGGGEDIWWSWRGRRSSQIPVLPRLPSAGWRVVGRHSLRRGGPSTSPGMTKGMEIPRLAWDDEMGGGPNRFGNRYKGKRRPIGRRFPVMHDSMSHRRSARVARCDSPPEWPNLLRPVGVGPIFRFDVTFSLLRLLPHRAHRENDIFPTEADLCASSFRHVSTAVSHRYRMHPRPMPI